MPESIREEDTRTNPDPSTAYAFGLDDRPPPVYALLYALQWVLLLFPALIIVSSLCAQSLDLSHREGVRFLQLTLLTSGLFTAIQALWGHRYPLLEGPSTAVLLTYLDLAREGHPWLVQGSALIASTVLMLFAATGTIAKILPLFTPNVIGVILMLIALTIIPHLVPAMVGIQGTSLHGEPFVFLISLALLLAITVGSYWLRGIVKTLTMTLGMALGTLLFVLTGRVDPGALSTAPWIHVPAPWTPFRPLVAFPAVTAFLFTYLALTVNSVGSLQGIAAVTEDARLKEGVRRGLFVNGLSGLCSGALGIVGTVSYSTSPGVVIITRVASRYVVAYCGIILVIAAFVPKLIALISLVPAAVVGAAMCAAMGGQLGAGLSVILSSGKPKSRDFFVVGIPLVVGTLLSHTPPNLTRALPGLFRAFGTNGLVAGIVLVLLLEHVLLRKIR